MNRVNRFAILVGMLLAALLITTVSCQQAPSAISEETTIDVLPTDYPDALPALTQLMLGTLLLEETPTAITPDQAEQLLPLWKMLLQGTLRDAQEREAVIRQIELTMRPEQLEAIAAMQLTQADLQAWADEHGIAIPTPALGQRQGNGTGPGDPATMATRPAERGGIGPGGDPSAMATRQAPFGSMSEEERAALRATMEAGGAPPFAGRPGRAMAAGTSILADPLLTLLAERAGNTPTP